MNHEHEASNNQRQLESITNQVHKQIVARIPDIGCMNPGEINSFMEAVDKLDTLMLRSSLFDERQEEYQKRLEKSWIES